MTSVRKELCVVDRGRPDLTQAESLVSVRVPDGPGAREVTVLVQAPIIGTRLGCSLLRDWVGGVYLAGGHWAIFQSVILHPTALPTCTPIPLIRTAFKRP